MIIPLFNMGLTIQTLLGLGIFLNHPTVSSIPVNPKRLVGSNLRVDRPKRPTFMSSASTSIAFQAEVDTPSHGLVVDGEPMIFLFKLG